MRRYAQMLRGKAERHRSLELLQRSHLPIEPLLRIGTIPVRPTHAGPQMSDLEPSQPFHARVQPMISEMKPLADPQPLGKMLSGELGSAVLTEQSHVVMPIVRTAFRFLVARGRRP